MERQLFGETGFWRDIFCSYILVSFSCQLSEKKIVIMLLKNPGRGDKVLMLLKNPGRGDKVL